MVNYNQLFAVKAKKVINKPIVKLIIQIIAETFEIFLTVAFLEFFFGVSTEERRAIIHPNGNTLTFIDAGIYFIIPHR